MFDIEKIIGAGGILAIAAIVFAESGLLIGFFLPGDTLLFTAGIVASQGKFDIATLIMAIVVAAIAGDNVGYAFGRRMGRRLYTRKDSLLFRKDHIEKAEKFYEAHGRKTIVLARFIPAIRTFAPIIAGAAHMNRRTFMIYNVVGALIWGVGVTLFGYIVGEKIPGIEKYLELFVLIGILAVFGPTILHVLRDNKMRRAISEYLKKLLVHQRTHDK